MGKSGNLEKQKKAVVSCSSAEAKYRAVSQGICEGICLKRLLWELKIPFEKPMKMYCDNQATINIVKNPVHHERTKNVEIDHHFIKGKVEEGLVKLLYIPTVRQTADILTKALPRTYFEDLCSKLGMINIYHPT